MSTDPDFAPLAHPAGCQCHCCLCDEITRLTRELSESREEEQARYTLMQQYREEIERLRERLAGQRESPHCPTCSCGMSQSEPEKPQGHQAASFDWRCPKCGYGMQGHSQLVQTGRCEEIKQGWPFSNM